ncbi:hypothetical protein ElyMa_001837600, partial [Elysia marginata]
GCVPMDKNMMREWDAPGLDILCRTCSFTSDPDPVTYDFAAACKRLQDAVKAPVFNPQTREILQKFQPVILNSYTPLYVQGDGNCLFRALSRGFFGTEKHHLHIRLLSALEMASQRPFYDEQLKDFSNFFGEAEYLCEPYCIEFKAASTPGSWSSITRFYAASAALKVAFRSYCPPIMNDYFMSSPLTRKICDRGVKRSAIPMVIVMWSSSIVPHEEGDFKPDHFVMLQKTEIRANQNDDGVTAVQIAESLPDLDKVPTTSTSDFQDKDPASPASRFPDDELISPAEAPSDEVDHEDDDENYKRRATWLEPAPTPIACVEYIGHYSGAALHGNAKTTREPYTRTDPSVLNAIKKASNTIKPREIYEQLKRKPTEDERPKNLRQVQNTKYHTHKRRRVEEIKQHQGGNNLGDNINQLHNAIHDHPFIQEIFLRKQRSRHRLIHNTTNSRYPAVLLLFSTG